MGMETSPELGASGCNKVPLTTFVQTDTNTFRDVVQRLTGGSPPSDPGQQPQVIKTTKNTSTNTTAGIANVTTNSTRKTKTTPSSCKLHERRQLMKMRPKLEIVKPTTTTFYSKPPSASSTSTSPSILSPCTIFSKLSILQQEQLEENKLGSSSPSATLKSGPSNHLHHHHILMNTQEEEKAIQGRRFYLHPSPRGGKPPELLTLFPLTSPKSCQKQQQSP